MTKKYIKIEYALLLLISVIILIIGLCTFHKDFFLNFFYDRCSDTFMDFFNSIRDAHDGHVYDEQKVIYPALANCYFFILSLFYPKEVVQSSFTERYIMQEQVISYVLYAIFLIAVICLLIFALIIRNKNKKWGIVLTISVLISMPMLFAVERGNIIILSIVLLICFVSLRDDENKYVREFALISLAIATAIKIYPALFILILLFDKSYKQFFRTCIYILGFILLPFVFYGGADGLYEMANNILSFSGNHSNAQAKAYSTSLIFFLKRFNIELKYASIISILLDAIYLFLMIIARKKWQKTYMIILIILNLSGSQIKYNALYFFVPLVMIFLEKDNNIFDYFSILLFAFLLFPNPFYIKNINTVSNLLWDNSVYILRTLILFACLADISYSCIKEKKLFNFK